ncbi:MAG: iron-containing alcohol dehydrogenase [Blautia sp.]|nr:iron-containing alcohol dehydrogenase [Blautia sp.]
MAQNMNSYMPVRVYTGAGCVRQNEGEFKKAGTKALLVTGRHSAKACGAYQDVAETLDACGIGFALFDGIGQNPLLTDCMKAAELAIAGRCDFVIGIGGGSPLDAAKCIAVLAANPGMTKEELYSLVWPEKPLPVIAVGTTAGTGSEVTKVAVITTPNGRKSSFRHDDIYPVAAFGDPLYTHSLPMEFTISTAIDAFSHSMESYFSRLANEISRCYAVQGIRIALPVLEKLALGAAELSAEDRETLYHASIYGGMAINVTGTCLPHAMGYLLTEQHGLPHGFACAMFLPEFLSINERIRPELAEAFLAAIGYGSEELTALLSKLLKDVHVTIDEEEIVREHGRWINNGSIAKGWGEITADMCDEILRKLGGVR